MPKTPDRYPGTREEDKIRMVDSGEEPTEAGEFVYKDGVFKFKDLLETFDPKVGQPIPKGTSFPGSPINGDPFIRTDLRLLFVYDSTRGKWLTPGRWVIGGSRGIIAGTGLVYFEGFNSTNGPMIPRDATFTAFTLKNDNVITRDLKVFKYDGVTTTLLATVPIVGTDRVYAPNANTDVNAGDMVIFAIDMSSGTGVLQNVFVTLEGAYRGT